MRVGTAFSSCDEYQMLRRRNALVTLKLVTSKRASNSKISLLTGLDIIDCTQKLCLRGLGTNHMRDLCTSHVLHCPIYSKYPIYSGYIGNAG